MKSIPDDIVGDTPTRIPDVFGICIVSPGHWDSQGWKTAAAYTLLYKRRLGCAWQRQTSDVKAKDPVWQDAGVHACNHRYCLPQKVDVSCMS